jgi:L-lysine 2,3-aminomutase
MPGRYPTQTILIEITKCDVLCANCHAEHTFRRRG